LSARVMVLLIYEKILR